MGVAGLSIATDAKPYTSKLRPRLTKCTVLHELACETDTYIIHLTDLLTYAEIQLFPQEAL